VKKIGQSEVIKLLEKASEPLSVGQIATMLDDDQKKISNDLNKMIQYKEVKYKEITKEIALKKYNCKRRMRLYFTKGTFLAVVDLATGKIFGCKKGSRTYLHEKAHIKFNNSELGAKISYYQIFFMMIALFVITLGVVINNKPVQVFGFLNALAMLLCYIIEETYCWVVAYRK